MVKKKRVVKKKISKKKVVLKIKHRRKKMPKFIPFSILVDRLKKSHRKQNVINVGSKVKGKKIVKKKSKFLSWKEFIGKFNGKK